MILIDTNAVLALLIGDRPAETGLVLEAVEQAVAQDEHILVCEAVLLETCNVLSRVYGLRRSAAAAAVDQLVGVAPFRVEDPEVVHDALLLMQRKPELAFTDCLLLVRGGQLGARVLTFDRRLQDALGNSAP